MSTSCKDLGPAQLTQKCLQFCEYVKGICNGDGRLHGIENHIERKNATFFLKNVLEDHINRIMKASN